MLDKVRSFLKLQSIQELLAEDNIDEVYKLWDAHSGNGKYLTSFFLQNGIQPTDYLTHIPNRAYKGLMFPILDLTDTNVKTVGSQAFDDCTMLRELYLGNVRYIGVCSFSGCTSLTNVTFPQALDSIDEEAFQYCHLEKLHIPTTVKRIGMKCFAFNKYLKEVTTDHTVETFKRVCCDIPLKYIFFNCPFVTKVTCRDGEIEIEQK
jgi:hypothetical protein